MKTRFRPGLGYLLAFLCTTEPCSTECCAVSYKCKSLLAHDLSKVGRDAHVPRHGRELAFCFTSVGETVLNCQGRDLELPGYARRFLEWLKFIKQISVGVPHSTLKIRRLSCIGKSISLLRARCSRSFSVYIIEEDH